MVPGGSGTMAMSAYPAGPSQPGRLPGRVGREGGTVLGWSRPGYPAGLGRVADREGGMVPGGGRGWFPMVPEPWPAWEAPGRASRLGGWFRGRNHREPSPAGGMVPERFRGPTGTGGLPGRPGREGGGGRPGYPAHPGREGGMVPGWSRDGPGDRPGWGGYPAHPDRPGRPGLGGRARPRPRRGVPGGRLGRPVPRGAPGGRPDPEVHPGDLDRGARLEAHRVAVPRVPRPAWPPSGASTGRSCMTTRVL